MFFASSFPARALCLSLAISVSTDRHLPRSEFRFRLFNILPGVSNRTSLPDWSALPTKSEQTSSFESDSRRKKSQGWARSGRRGREPGPPPADGASTRNSAPCPRPTEKRGGEHATPGQNSAADRRGGCDQWRVDRRRGGASVRARGREGGATSATTSASARRLPCGPRAMTRVTCTST